MKKTIITVISLLLVFSFCSCGNDNFGNSNEQKEDDISLIKGTVSDVEGSSEQAGASAENDKISEEKKVMVAYFSCTGNTKGIAEKIAGITGGRLFEITPQIPYTDVDLDYNDDNARTAKENSDNGARPAIKGEVTGLDETDTVFLGYPIWWGKAPKIICTFLENNDFSGKTIIPFCTSGSSDIGTSAFELHSLCTEETVWSEGKRFSATASDEEIKEWINSPESGCVS